MRKRRELCKVKSGCVYAEVGVKVTAAGAGRAYVWNEWRGCGKGVR